jgi:membrane-associated phospholipid phosphatase
MIQNNQELFLLLNAAGAFMPAWIWMFLSLLGTGWAVFSLAMPCLVIAPKVFYAIVLAAPIAGLVSRTVKIYFAAPRPSAVLEPGIFNTLGVALHTNAMPSGHTITAFAAASAVVLSAPKKMRMGLLLLFPIAVGVGLSRIMIGAHWVEDVIVGAFIGTVTGAIGGFLAHRIPDTWFVPRSWGLRALSSIGPFCMYVLLTQRLDFAENRGVQWLLAVGVCVAFILFWRRSLAGSRIGN